MGHLRKMSERTFFEKFKTTKEAFAIVSGVLIILTSGLEAFLLDLVVEPAVRFIDVFLLTAPLTVALTVIFIMAVTEIEKSGLEKGLAELLGGSGIVLLGAMYIGNTLGFIEVRPSCSGPHYFSSICFLGGFLQSYGILYFAAAIVLSFFLTGLFFVWRPV